MLIDLHAHSSGISQCCRIPYEQVLKQTLDSGMDGIILTNHYKSYYVQDGCVDDLVERYIAEYHAAEQYGREIGCKVFFGIEVTLDKYPGVDMLIYGVGPEFLREHSYIYGCTQKELYEQVKSDRGILIQAHPFRNTTMMDTDYLDGVEINCHPLYGNSYSKELLEIAEEKHLIVTCGGDYHADTYRPKCGMFLPDEIGDHEDFREYLLSAGEKKLCIQEPNCDEVVTVSVETV